MPYKQIGLICTSESLPSFVPFLKKHGFVIKALWCPNPETAIVAAADNEIPFVGNEPDEILLRKEVEMVVIIGKPSLQSHMCVKALGIGKHVFCSAPSACSVSEAQKMVQASQYYPQILSLVGFGLRRLELFRRMRNMLSKGTIGQPLVTEVRVQSPPLFSPTYNWLWESSMGGGVLNIIGAHIIDLLAFLLNNRALRVQGLVKIAKKKTEDFRKINSDNFSSFLLKIQGSHSATITLNSMNECIFDQVISITGTCGRLMAHNSKLYWLKPGCIESELVFDEDSTDNDHLKMNPHIEFPFCHLMLYQKSLLKLLESLAAAVPHYDNKLERTGHSWREFVPHLATVAGFDDVLYVRAVIDAVRTSSTNGDWVRVDFEP